LFYAQALENGQLQGKSDIEVLYKHYKDISEQTLSQRSLNASQNLRLSPQEQTKRTFEAIKPWLHREGFDCSSIADWHSLCSPEPAIYPDSYFNHSWREKDILHIDGCSR
jgi:hypothetical protein